MTEQEAKMAQKVQLYDLRLIFTSGDKDTYTTQEIVELLDKIAMAKDLQCPGGGGASRPFSKSVEVTRWRIPPQRKPGERPTRQGS